MKKRKRKAGRKKKTATGIPEFMSGGLIGNLWTEAGFDAYWMPNEEEEDYYRMATLSDLRSRIACDIRKLFERAAETYSELLRRKGYHGDPLHEHSEGPKAAASALAAIAKDAARFLEALYAKRPTLMKSIARENEHWPVLLGRKPANGNIMRKAFARDYLTGLELNSECTSPVNFIPEGLSPFQRAARTLYSRLWRLKQLITPPGRSEWFDDLLSLPLLMTESNASEWWRLAKVWLDERWEKAPEEFEGLIKYLGLRLSEKTPYPSSIKSRVIDNDLKDAFLSLARPDL